MQTCKKEIISEFLLGYSSRVSSVLAELSKVETDNCSNQPAAKKKGKCRQIEVVGRIDSPKLYFYAK